MRVWPGVAFSLEHVVREKKSWGGTGDPVIAGGAGQWNIIASHHLASTNRYTVLYCIYSSRSQVPSVNASTTGFVSKRHLER